MLPKNEIERGLTTAVVGRKLFLFDTIDSTNACARALAEAEVDEGAVVVSEYQTEGKGRLGRTWDAPAGENLLFSVVLRPRIERGRVGLLTLSMALAVARALEHECRCTVQTKWPNDVLIDGKKVCGILIENSLEGDRIAYSVVGIGINVNQRTFPSHLSGRATSLASALGQSWNRPALLRSLLTELDKQYRHIHESIHDIVPEWKKRSPMLGGTYELIQGDRRIRGKALDVQDDGALIMEVDGSKAAFYAGDVLVADADAHSPTPRRS